LCGTHLNLEKYGWLSQRQIAISCLPDETQEHFLHSGKFGCSVLLHFLVACSLIDPFAQIFFVFFLTEITDFDTPCFKLKSLCGSLFSYSSIIFIFASKLNDFLFPILIFKK
jgi:hypothetical protein